MPIYIPKLLKRLEYPILSLPMGLANCEGVCVSSTYKSSLSDKIHDDIAIRD